MPQSRTFLPKILGGRSYMEAPKKIFSEKFIDDFLQYGPWRVDWEKIASDISAFESLAPLDASDRIGAKVRDLTRSAASKCKKGLLSMLGSIHPALSDMAEDFWPQALNMEENLFSRYAIPVDCNTDVFQYYYTDQEAFLVWLDAPLVNNDPASLNGAHKNWRQAIENANSLLPRYGEFFRILSSMDFRLANLDSIRANSYALPARIKNGVCICLNRKGLPIILDENFVEIRKGFLTNSSPTSKFFAGRRIFAIFRSSLDAIRSTPGKANDPRKKRQLMFKKSLLEADFNRCRLGVLPASLLTDPERGHWNLFWPHEKNAPDKWYDCHCISEDLAARDPSRDIQDAPVAIDFGTSNSVAAFRDAHGRISLLRVGVQGVNTASPVSSSWFDNPVILNLENASGLLAAWHGAPYRPMISWTDVQCSHQARAEMGSARRGILTGLKSWARSADADKERTVLDGKGEQVVLRLPAPGEDVSAEKSTLKKELNPIELYAFFLGLCLNNQHTGNGRIFTRYYLTFPIKFDRAARDRILSSFRSGLARSLPPSLIYASGFDPSRLIVEETANEPAALAAATPGLTHLNRQQADIVE